MATFYIISLLVILPLFYGTPTSVVTWASYLCSVVFQGIALPVLGYTSRKASDKTDKVMNEMFVMTAKIEAMTEHISKLSDANSKLIKHIAKQEDAIQKELEEIEEVEKIAHSII